MLSLKLLKNFLSINCDMQSAQAIRRSNPSQLMRYFSDEQTNMNQRQHQKKSFASLLRNSTFIQMGEHKNVNVVGKIFQVQDNNIFVDFGGKFHCVCDLDTFSQKPGTREKFKRGAKVIVKLQDFELSARFLGATKDTTLLEADGRLLGLYKHDIPIKKSLNKQSEKFSEPSSKTASSANSRDDAQTGATEPDQIEPNLEVSPETVVPLSQNFEDLNNAKDK